MIRHHSVLTGARPATAARRPHAAARSSPPPSPPAAASGRNPPRPAALRGRSAALRAPSPSPSPPAGCRPAAGRRRDDGAPTAAAVGRRRRRRKAARRGRTGRPYQHDRGSGAPGSAGPAMRSGERGWRVSCGLSIRVCLLRKTEQIEDMEADLFRFVPV